MKYKTDIPGHVVVPAPREENKQYLHTSAAGVVVPFAQTIITGVLVFIGTALLGWLVFDLVDPIKPAVILMVLSTLVVWLWRLRQWASLTRVEQLTGIDLNRDGVIGKRADPEVVRLKWSHINDSGSGPSYQAREMDFPISREQLIDLAAGLLDGKSFSENIWTGPGRPFSINEFRMVRTVMYKRGLIELASPKDVRQGFKLTEEGWSVMEHLVEEYGSQAKTEAEE